MPHMQHAGTIFYVCACVGVCVRTATTNQMVSLTRPGAEVLSTRVLEYIFLNTRTHITQGWHVTK